MQEEFDTPIVEHSGQGALVISCDSELAGPIVPADMVTLGSLAPLYLWNAAYFKMKFKYQPQIFLHVLILPPWQNPSIRISATPGYLGSKSWVSLGKESWISRRGNMLALEPFPKKPSINRRVAAPRR